MDIGEIAIQPDEASLLAAYRPIYFEVYADSLVTPAQPMYADVYFIVSSSIVFYKTFTSFSTRNVAGTNSVFEFDIQDAMQEYLSTFIPQITINNADDAPGGWASSIVRFRGSTYVGGVLVPNALVPVQGTSTTAPVNGTGVDSNFFYVINATLKPDLRSNELNSPETILQASLPFTPTLSDQRIYPLTNLPRNPISHPVVDICPEIYVSDHAALPVFIIQFGTYGGLPTDGRLCTLSLELFTNGTGSPIGIYPMLPNIGVGTGITYFPLGMQEVQLLAPSAVPVMADPNNNVYYRIVLNDLDSSTVAFISPMYKARNKTVENKRLWFQNYWGHWEQVSFARNSEKFTAASSEQFRPYVTNLDNGQSQQYTGRQRFNVRVQNEETLIGIFPESLMPWLKEMLGSPFVLMDTPSDTNYFILPAALPPYKIVDDTYITRKTVIDGRINYEVTVKVVPSLDYITLRN